MSNIFAHAFVFFFGDYNHDHSNRHRHHGGYDEQQIRSDDDNSLLSNSPFNNNNNLNQNNQNHNNNNNNQNNLINFGLQVANNFLFGKSENSESGSSSSSSSGSNSIYSNDNSLLNSNNNNNNNDKTFQTLNFDSSTQFTAALLGDESSNSGDYDNVRLGAFLIAGTFAVLASVISFWSIYKHMTNYRRPDMQRRIVRILLMVPIYAIDSWFSLRFQDAAIYLNTLRDVYEAYVLYEFFWLLVSALHGEQEITRILGGKGPLPHPWPFNYCFADLQPSHPRFYIRLKQGLIQFMLIKPLMALFSIAFEPFGLLDEGAWRVDRAYPYIAFIDNLSITIAFYALIVFYSALSAELKPFKPFFKFLCVKLVIFFSFWQSIGVAGLVAIDVIRDAGAYTADNVATGVQDFLICVEMFGAALLHSYAFPYSEYESMMNTSKLPLKYTCYDIFTISDVVDDTSSTFNIRKGRNYGKLGENSEPLPFDDVDEGSDSEADFSVAKKQVLLDENDAL